jgi:hypothetical protein
MARIWKLLVVGAALVGLGVFIGTNVGGAEASGPSVGRWVPRAGAATGRSVEPSAAVVRAAAARSLALINEDTDDFTLVRHGPGVNPGDEVLFRNKLRDPRTNAFVGVISNHCSITFHDSSECEGTLILFHRGKITFAGNVPIADHFVVAVTGGTQEFRGVRGQAFVTDTTNPRDPIVVQLG